jgi:hypothetical protein
MEKEMNIVVSGSRVQIYGEDLQTYKELPVGSYDVCFSQMAGFFLTKRPDLLVKENKIYGNSEEKVDKVLNSFSLTDRNFGVILSGQKGIGKSLFARMLANKASEKGLPIITVTEYIPGIADFLSSIEQEVVVIFDEFEKTFGEQDGCNPQEEMLPLFDGIDSGKKLFVITINEISKLNSYLLNRPGRFHYHFSLTNPSDTDVREYLEDKLLPQYHGNIEKIVNFAKTIDITFDYLRAIVFELNQGYSLESTLQDLNITRVYNIRFNVMFTLNDGTVFYNYDQQIDLYDSKTNYIRVYNDQRKGYLFTYHPSDIHVENGDLIIDPSKVSICIDEDDYWDFDENERQKIIERDKSIKVKNAVFVKNRRSLVDRYLV